jgi:hypothetical protein
VSLLLLPPSSGIPKANRPAAAILAPDFSGARFWTSAEGSSTMLARAIVRRASGSAGVHSSGSRFATSVGPNSRLQGNKGRA